MEVKKQGNRKFVEEISAIPGGEGIKLCIQCGTCSASCPNANRMDYTPRKLIAMARAGMRDEVLTSNSPWFCLSCYLCTVRCPRGIKPTDIMHALECLAVSNNVSSGRTYTPKMYRSFTDFVYSLGNVPEMSFMIWYYLLTNPLRALKMLPQALGLFKRGRLSIKAKRMKPEAEAQLKKILDKAETIAIGGR